MVSFLAAKRNRPLWFAGGDGFSDTKKITTFAQLNISIL
jgi:hypothetical protein